MSKFAKIAICVVLSFSVCFIAIGFAALSDQLEIDGTAEVSAPNIVYVSMANITAGAGAITYTGGTTSIEDPAALLSADLDFSASSTVTLAVRVFNNTEYDYVYKGAEAPTVSGDSVNTGFTFATSGITAEGTRVDGTPLNAGHTIEFAVTYTRSGVEISSASSAIRFMFGYATEDDKDAAIVNNAIDAFQNALNDKIMDADGDTPLDNLIEEMQAEADKKHSTDYIGNVVGASSGDSKFINQIFTVTNSDGTTQNCLKIEIAGVETNVTVMVKKKDMDSDGTDEMVLYMTPDDIEGTSFLGGNSSSTATVYAVVFSQNSEGVWENRSGVMFKGKANLNLYYTTDNYKGSGFLGMQYACDSFNTETWVSTEVYYNQATGSSVEEVFAAFVRHELSEG